MNEFVAFTDRAHALVAAAGERASCIVSSNSSSADQVVPESRADVVRWAFPATPRFPARRKNSCLLTRATPMAWRYRSAHPLVL
jgi:hypothetical protein